MISGFAHLQILFRGWEIDCQILAVSFPSLRSQRILAGEPCQNRVERRKIIMSENNEPVMIKVDKKWEAEELAKILQENFQAKVNFFTIINLVIDAKTIIKSKKTEKIIAVVNLEKENDPDSFVKFFELDNETPFFILKRYASGTGEQHIDYYEGLLCPEAASPETIRELYDMGFV
jgi:hypothetical protein